MADFHEINLTLVVRKSSRYPYLKASILGARSYAKEGELEIPLRVKFDKALLTQRTRLVVVEAPASELPQVQAGPVQQR